MMLTACHRSVVLVFALYCSVCSAKFIPDEFAHLYEPQDLAMSFDLPNGVAGIVDIVGNYDGALNISSENEKILNNLMLKSGIKKDILENIMGVIFSERSCNAYCNDFFVEYDFDSKLISIAVPAKYLDGKYIDSSYVEAEVDNQGVTLDNKLYVSAYDSNFSATYSLNSVFGLGKGFVTSDFNIISSDDNEDVFSLNDLSYSFAMQGHQLYFGYNKYGHNIENVTGDLDYTTPKNQAYLALESSNNLLLKDSKSSSRIYFDMKSKGMVSIVRDGQTLKNEFFTAGQHYIEYSSLPRGNYKVKVIIKPDGMKEEVMYKTINNASTERSASGFDYHISLNNVDNNDDSLTYIQGIVSAPLYDVLELGLSTKSMFNDSFLGVQASFDFDDVYLSGYLDKMLQNDIFYSKFQLNYKNFQVDYSSYNKSEQDNEFSDAIYGHDSYQQYSIGANFKLLGGRFGFFKNHNTRDNDFGSLINSTLSFSYSTTIYNDWSLQVGYVRNNSGNDFFVYEDDGQTFYNEDSFSISVNIPLSDDVYATSSMDTSESGNVRFVSSIENSNIVDNEYVNMNGSISSTVANSNSSVGTSINVRNKSDTYAANGYGYIDTAGHSSINGSIESTMLIPESYDNVYFTKEQSDSYLIVKSNREEMQNGIAYVKKNGSGSRSVMLNGDVSIIPVNNYEQYEYELDYESSGFQSNSLTKKSSFTYPGTLSIIDSKIKKVISFMTYFEDFNKESLNNIRCVGDGCVDVTRVGDGIYSISVFDDYNYKIVSNEEYCLIDSVGVEQRAGKSLCFPNIKEDKDSGLQIVNHGLGSKNETFIYLGYMKSMPQKVYETLVDNGVQPKRYEFGKGEYYWFAKLTKSNKQDLIDLARLDVMEQVEQLANNSYELHRYSRVN